jgi:hypothetical protein
MILLHIETPFFITHTVIHHIQGWSNLRSVSPAPPNWCDIDLMRLYACFEVFRLIAHFLSD